MIKLPVRNYAIKQKRTDKIDTSNSRIVHTRQQDFTSVIQVNFENR